MATPASASPHDPRKGAVIGGCRIERLLGRGGMGSVYLARQERLARPVALKVLDGGDAADDVYRARFLLEARIAARVEHENVVAIYDAGEDGGVLYLVLQLVAGGDLASYAAGRRLAPLEVARIGLQVARALAAAWAEGIVHLDVKPANVLRSDRDLWKVADFGIARLAGRQDPDLGDDSAADEPGTVSGSPPYMPPEQWRGVGVDGRTDLYALGVTMYQLLSGRLPCVPEKTGEGLGWYRAHAAGPKVPLEAAAPGTPRPLASLVERCLARYPSERPASAAVLVDELLDLIASDLAETTAARAVPAPPAEAPARVASPSGAATIALPTPPRAAPTRASAPPSPGSRIDLPAAAAPGEARPTGRGGPQRVRSVFVGRGAELSAFDAAVLAAREGRGSVLLVTGPAGVGRTRFLHEAAVAASAHANVLRGRGSADSPLHAVRHILRGLFDLERPGTKEELRARLSAWLGRLAAPGAGVARLRAALLALLLGGPETAGGAARDVPIPTLAALVRARATRAFPVVVAVDQLEEADRPTLAFLAALGEASADAPLILALACKDGELSDLALAAIGAPAALAARIALAPLSPAEVEAVAATALGGPPRPPLPPALVAAVAPHAAGLPKVAVSAVREGLAQGVVRTEAGTVTGDAAALGSIAGRLARRLAARPAAEPAAAAATPVPPGTGDAASRSIDRRLAQGVRLREFHDLPGATKQLELANARVGDETPPLRAGRVRLELARTLRMAGTRLGEAAALATRAAIQAAEGGDPGLEVEAAVELGLAHYLERRYEPALLALDRGAAALATARERSAEGRTARGAAAAEADLAGPGAPPPLSGERARALSCELAHTRALVLDRLGGEANARAASDAYWAALRSAGAAGDADLFGRVCQSLGESRRRAGDDAGAESFLTLSARYKERLGDLAGLAIAYGSLARLARDRGEREAAEDLFRRDLAIALTIGDHRGVGVAASSLGELCEERFLASGDAGALAAAESAFSQARRAAARTANALDDAIACYYTGRFLCRARARAVPAAREEGLALLERSRAILAALGKPEFAAKAEAAIAAARRS